MSPNRLELLERRRKAVYDAVRAANPELYWRAVEIGHLALIDFGGNDETRRAATVEASVMSLLATALNIEVTTEQNPQPWSHDDR